MSEVSATAIIIAELLRAQKITPENLPQEFDRILGIVREIHFRHVNKGKKDRGSGGRKG